MHNSNVVFQLPFIEVKYLAEIHTLEYQWKGFIKNNDALLAMRKITALVKEKNASALLADLTAFGGGSSETSQWVDAVWSPDLHLAGIRHLAIVVPVSIFADFTNKVALGVNTLSLFNIQKFKSVEEAYHWIAQQK